MIVNLIITFLVLFLQAIVQMSCLCVYIEFDFYPCLQPPSSMITMVFFYVKIQSWRAFFNYFTVFYYIVSKKMARRRQEIALQTEIESQEEWNDTVNKEGLTGILSYLHLQDYSFLFLHIYIIFSFSVVDVYQQWAGPCKSVEGNFRRIKLETGEKLLKFALVIIVLYGVSIHSLSLYIHANTHCYFVSYIIIIKYT